MKKEQLDKIKKLYNTIPVKEIAKIIGLSEGVVYNTVRVLKDMGELPEVSLFSGKQWKITPEIHENIKEDYINGMPVKELTQKYKVSYNTIYSRVKGCVQKPIEIPIINNYDEKLSKIAFNQELMSKTQENISTSIKSILTILKQLL